MSRRKTGTWSDSRGIRCSESRARAACGYARAKRQDRALDLLDRAVATGRGFRAWIEGDPDLDPLRALPRYRAILSRLPP